MTTPRADRQMAELAVAIHGVLAALHALGIVYNARRSNRFETIAHAAACAFDIYAVRKHVRQVADLRLAAGLCPTSQTAQCTCPPNGICNDCTVPLDRW